MVVSAIIAVIAEVITAAYALDCTGNPHDNGENGNPHDINNLEPTDESGPCPEVV